jgi:hypothetical protein
MKAEKGDILGALADYTAAIELPGARPEDRAASLNNRGVIRMNMRNYDGAKADFYAVMAMKDVPEDIRKTAADNFDIVKLK